MKKLIYGGLVLLAILHQDFWWWHDSTLVFGFMPIGLAYHALYSVVAGLAWYLVLTYAWPSELERFAEGEDPEVKP